MATYNFDNYTTVNMNGTEMFQVKYGTTVVYNKTLINFDEGGGAVVSDKYAHYKRAYGTLPTTSRTGHTFNGWYTGVNQTGSKILSTTVLNSVIASQTLYAAWTPKTYIVTFNADGGTTPNPISKSVIYGSTYGTLPTTSKTPYTFGGWFTAENGGGTQRVSTSTVSTASNHTLYAHWMMHVAAPVILYPTTPRQNGISIPISNTNEFVCELLYDFNNTTPNISKGNIGASGSSAILFDGLLAPSTQYTLYLRFKYNGNYSEVRSYTFYTSDPTSYIVSFNANGGSTHAPTWKSVAYWSEYGTLPTASRVGYTFNGWFTAASGGTQVISTTQMTRTTNHAIYAQWTTNTTPTWVLLGENSSSWSDHIVVINISNWSNRVAEAKQYLDTNYPAVDFAEDYGISVQVQTDTYLDFAVKYL